LFLHGRSIPPTCPETLNYCNILRDDGLSYGDYPSASLRTGSEQLTFLLFLKMADEHSRPPFNKRSPIPKGFDWASLLAKDSDEMEIHYRHLLETLGKEKGMLGVIFRKAQNKISARSQLTWQGMTRRLKGLNLVSFAAIAERLPSAEHDFGNSF